jgi:two-component system, chemotaxis family, CheB/CheR fusion protein
MNANGGDNGQQARCALRVLVVENEVDSGDSLCLLLRIWGFDFELSRTSEEALIACRQYQPHVVLMDLGLPRMNGYELARRFREQTDLPRPVIIALTGYGDAEHRKRANRDFDLYLLKPTDLNALLDLLTAFASKNSIARVLHPARLGKSSHSERVPQ